MSGKIQSATEVETTSKIVIEKAYQAWVEEL
jgi:hypothetical protein